MKVETLSLQTVGRSLIYWQDTVYWKKSFLSNRIRH